MSDVKSQDHVADMLSDVPAIEGDIRLNSSETVVQIAEGLVERVNMSSESDDSSSDSSSNLEESLGSQIVKKFQKSVFDKRDFLPVGCIDKLITECSVIKELVFTQEEMRESSNIKVLNFVLKEGKKIFAIMLIVGLKGKDLRKALNQFRRSKFGDASLPITDEIKNALPFFGVPAKKPWDDVLIRRFCEEQWLFLSPVFSEEKLSLRLHTNDILPFIYQDDDVKSGAFGEVHQVTVHPFHHENPILTVRFSFYSLYLIAYDQLSEP
jgi:hypothetical protein